ncbi:MAG: cystathionine gamma-synthase [Micavibrio sp.]|nr:MAG: cystathionine gamma-synthase [Micavibrio sp.]
MAKKLKRRTTIVQAGIGSDPAYHDVIPPLHLSSTFKIDGIEKKGPYEYSRTRNPTRDILAEAITTLEGGANACITSSGMAAITLMLQLLKPGDLLVAPFDCYGRAYKLIQTLADKGHFKLKFADLYSSEGLDDAFSKPPRMVFIESPSNPVMRTSDIADICKRAKKHDALVAVDNTFLSPILQQPLALGADLVIHSTTKFLNGHSDVVSGAVVTKTNELWEELDFWSNSMGLIGAPFDSYMVLRGMRTLELRINRAQENAGTIAEMLAAHPAIKTIYYPGLPSDSNHAIAKKQQEGFGAMLSFELKGGLEAARQFVEAVEIFSLAQSLGGTESLLCHPATMTHVAMGEKARAEAGVTDGLLRLSIGIEHVDDLMDDLNAALIQASAKAA